ncbi:Arylsulfatase [Thalassoglobus neptunius]|uniref:Arylsulfatase n=1 Tax=Thalassoglobus neptunius TaxID=1938619 RepID=A0A5C5X2I5_9PLAN|nr:sulfatase [Thalassoglobus neptunius]TWT57040.1 Arylsulfatase [Thalassoglobus neptunius]
MDRLFPLRQFVFVIVALLVTHAAVLDLKAADTDNSSQLKRPNIVWLISEDNSKHFLKLFDEHGAETPHIAALAEHGIIYDHAFSNSPVCSVARTTLITSCYGPRIGTQYHRRSKLVPMPDGLRMFPYYLREAGYYTANNNKKDYNAIEGDGVWDESSGRASWRKRAEGQPFFYKQSFKTTHESSLHFPRKTYLNEETNTDPESVFVAPYHPDTEMFRYTYARYHDRIQMVDREIGAVVKALEEDGLLEDTIIFYFGDHGGVLPRGKGYAYESGLHVPLVVRVPKNWSHLVDETIGSRQDGFVSFVDFGPTALSLAGVEVPTGIDGKAFLGKGIKSQEVASRDFAFGYADRFDEKYDVVRTIRKGKYEYVRNYQPFNMDGLQNNYRYIMLAYQEWRELFERGELNEAQSQFFRPRPAEMLFDIESDPHEVSNLAGDPEHADKLEEMRTLMSTFVSDLPDLSFYPESELAKHAFDNPTQFGKEHQKEIAKLVEIADLSLVPFDEARRGLRRALQSENPWERYWGLISCTVHGEAAKRFVERARQLAESDEEPLVRVRAAEFLALTADVAPQEVILEALKETDDGIEAGLILNSLTLLRDGEPGYEFEISEENFRPSVLKNDTVQRRLQYLSADK